MVAVAELNIAEDLATVADTSVGVQAEVNRGTRRLLDGDRAAVTAMLLKLDHWGRYCRFCQVTSDAEIIRYASSIDFTRSIVLGYSDGAGLAAIAEILPCVYVPSACEVALCVSPTSQGGGLGQSILQEAIGVAQGNGLTRLVLTYSSGNAPMQALVNRLERLIDGRNQRGAAAFRLGMAPSDDTLPALASGAVERRAIVQLC
jgi:GNAT superfamily N-acetyltransferase